MIPHSKPTISKADVIAVTGQLAGGMLAKGEKTAQVQSALEQLFGWDRAVCFSSGKAALITALKLIGIRVGVEVILPTYVCRSVYDAVKYVGGRPILVDIGPDYCIDPEAVEKAISSATKAVIVVHPFGIEADVERISLLCKEHGITMIEDIAQSIGIVNGRPVTGITADVVFGSFHATKMLASGEGGFLGLKTESLSDKWFRDESAIDAGANFSDLAASLTLSQLSRLEDFTAMRNELATAYREKLKDVEGLVLPDLKQRNCFRFPVQIDADFDKVRAWMDEGGIQVRKGVDYLLHWLEGRYDFPVAESIYKRTVSLPLYPSLNMEQFKRVCDQLVKGMECGFEHR